MCCAVHVNGWCAVLCMLLVDVLCCRCYWLMCCAVHVTGWRAVLCTLLADVLCCTCYWLLCCTCYWLMCCAVHVSGWCAVLCMLLADVTALEQTLQFVLCIICTVKTLVSFQQAAVLIILAATTVYWQLGKATFKENRSREDSVLPGRFAVSSGE